MTDWPDDWFRGGSQDAAANQANNGPNPPAPGRVSRGDPTVQLPTRTPGASGSGSGGISSGPAAGSPAGQSAAPGGPTPQPAGGSGWPDQPALHTPGGSWSGGVGGGGGSRWRNWLRPRRVTTVLAVLLSVVIVGSVASYFYFDSKLTKKNILVDYSGRPVPGAGQNWLITGSDSRQGLTRAQERRLHTGHDISGKRSDTIMVLHMPGNGQRPVLISLPRDSWVPIPGYGYNKINAAYALGGPELLAKTVQNVTGLYINHYMGIGFGGFVRVVDAVGGVRICLKAPLADPKAGLRLHKGCHVLKGRNALGFVRSRETFTTSDLQRIQDQRIFLAALLRRLTSFGVIADPFRSFPAASGVAGSLTVDKGTSLSQLIRVAFALRNPITTTVPIANAGYATPTGESAVLWNRAAALQLFKDLRTDAPIAKSLITGSKQNT
jgi:LCP family protein required for cell wall assembly